jgi:hypothetical protein
MPCECSGSALASDRNRTCLQRSAQLSRQVPPGGQILSVRHQRAISALGSSLIVSFVGDALVLGQLRRGYSIGEDSVLGIGDLALLVSRSNVVE